MGKFNFGKTIEHTFKDNVEFANDIIDEYNTGKDIIIAVTWGKVPEIIRGVLNKTEIIPYDIDFAYPEINGYSKEYIISLCHDILDDNDILFVEQAFSDKLEKYVLVEGDDNTTVFVSQNTNTSLYKQFVEGNSNIVLFDVESDC